MTKSELVNLQITRITNSWNVDEKTIRPVLEKKTVAELEAMPQD